ncbi:hypothetical protein G5V59_02860 [Nocardioides sp. W3-2-3]|uniref:hypothetical protein n=1 Tax=Nocardioides convexus TaxID=2712224 RepID=UPI0024189505|nr:hypothetical protein [Nocardioides convexus]NGZ99681.1 hypothetical protein [Nocardioides convexus]
MLFTAGGIATPADAAMMMQARRRGRLRRLRHLQVRQPGAARRGDREGHHLPRRPGRRREGLPRPGRGDGRHQRRRVRPSRTVWPSAAGSRAGTGSCDQGLRSGSSPPTRGA